MDWRTKQRQLLTLGLIGRNPTQFLADLGELGFTQKYVAAETGHPPKEVSDWAHKRRPVPKGVLAWLRLSASNRKKREEIEYLRKRLRACLDYEQANGLTPHRDSAYDPTGLAKRNRKGMRTVRRKTVIQRPSKR